MRFGIILYFPKEENLHCAGFDFLVSHINAQLSNDEDINTELLPCCTSIPVTTSI